MSEFLKISLNYFKASHFQSTTIACLLLIRMMNHFGYKIPINHHWIRNNRLSIRFHPLTNLGRGRAFNPLRNQLKILC